MNISVSNLFMMSQIVHPSPFNDAYLKRISYTLRLEFQREFMRTLRTDWLKKKKKELLGSQEMRKLLKYGLSFKRVVGSQVIIEEHIRFFILLLQNQTMLPL